MKSSMISVLVTILLALVVMVSDYFLKHASSNASPFLNRNFFIAMAITTANSFGWVLVMPHLKPACSGVIHRLVVVLTLCLAGAAFFGEHLNAREWVGVGLAISSLLLYQPMG
jgi:drug/metabolite transporter (DMT)-like permease